MVAYAERASPSLAEKNMGHVDFLEQNTRPITRRWKKEQDEKCEMG